MNTILWKIILNDNLFFFPKLSITVSDKILRQSLKNINEDVLFFKRSKENVTIRRRL